MAPHIPFRQRRPRTSEHSGQSPDGSQSRWRAVLREPTVIGVSCREHVSESELPGNTGHPLLRTVTLTADI
jgi:hypothetical protein